MQQAGQGEGAAPLGCLHWSQQPQDVRLSMLASWRLATQLASLTDPHIGHFTGATHRPWENTWDYNADHNQAKEEVLEGVESFQKQSSHGPQGWVTLLHHCMAVCATYC